MQVFLASRFRLQCAAGRWAPRCWAARLEGSEYMYTTAEIGVALAGFAALVISFRQRQDSSLTDADRLVVASLVERGLMAAVRKPD